MRKISGEHVLYDAFQGPNSIRVTDTLKVKFLFYIFFFNYFFGYFVAIIQNDFICTLQDRVISM